VLRIVLHVAWPRTLDVLPGASFLIGSLLGVWLYYLRIIRAVTESNSVLAKHATPPTRRTHETNQMRRFSISLTCITCFSVFCALFFIYLALGDLRDPYGVTALLYSPTDMASVSLQCGALSLTLWYGWIPLTKVQRGDRSGVTLGSLNSTSGSRTQKGISSNKTKSPSLDKDMEEMDPLSISNSNRPASASSAPYLSTPVTQHQTLTHDNTTPTPSSRELELLHPFSSSSSSSPEITSTTLIQRTIIEENETDNSKNNSGNNTLITEMEEEHEEKETDEGFVV